MLHNMVLVHEGLASNIHTRFGLDEPTTAIPFLHIRTHPYTHACVQPLSQCVLDVHMSQHTQPLTSSLGSTPHFKAVV